MREKPIFYEKKKQMLSKKENQSKETQSLDLGIKKEGFTYLESLIEIIVYQLFERIASLFARLRLTPIGFASLTIWVLILSIFPLINFKHITYLYYEFVRFLSFLVFNMLGSNLT
jgi:hypothetical protein